jgi:hypothetical protein
VKKFIIERVLVPAVVALPLIMGLVIVYDSYEHTAALREACSILGGVYIDNETCVSGKNLFAGK